MNLAARLRIPPPVLDAAIALVVALIGLGELWVNLVGKEFFPGSRAAHTVFILAVAAPLVWRRRWPMTTLVAVAVISGVWSSTMFSVHQQPPFEPFVAQLLVAYSAGAYTAGRHTRAAVVIIAIATASDIPTLIAGGPASDIVPADLMLLLAFGLGVGLARHRRRADTNAERAAHLEAAQGEAARQAVAEERARIARELHDVISHDVSLMVLQASVERRVLADDQAPTGQTLATIETAGREALAELRRMLGVLRKSDSDPPLAPQPGLAHLHALVEQARAAGLAVNLVVEGDPRPVPAGLDLAAYRIVQESLTNAAKHAPGHAATATVRYSQDTLEIEVVDEGTASPLPARLPGGGHGLVGMRERVALYGGTLEAGRAPGGGFHVRARIPIGIPA